MASRLSSARTTRQESIIKAGVTLRQSKMFDQIERLIEVFAAHSRDRARWLDHAGRRAESEHRQTGGVGLGRGSRQEPARGSRGVAGAGLKMNRR